MTALRNVSVTARSGDVIGLAGPSGSGKSTLLHAMAGLLVPTAGTIELNASCSPTNRRASYTRKPVGACSDPVRPTPELFALGAGVAALLTVAGSVLVGWLVASRVAPIGRDAAR